MALASDLVEKTRTHLLSDRREELSTLATAVTTAGQTAWVLTDDLGPVRRGAVLSVDIEDVYVSAYDQPSKTATVIRAYNGSTAATHLISAVVRANPHHSTWRIFGALNDDLADLSGLIPYYTAASVTYDSDYDAFALPAGVISVYDLRWETTGTRRRWPRITDYTLLTNMDSTEFAQTTAIQLYSTPSDGQSLRVIYQSAYTPFAALSSNVTTTGLPTTAYDVPPLGAAARLIRASEVKRNISTQQGETRRAQEVPPGAVLASANGLLRTRAERVRTEANLIRAAHPYVKRHRQ